MGLDQNLGKPRFAHLCKIATAKQCCQISFKFPKFRAEMVPKNWPKIAQRLPVEKQSKIRKVSPYRAVGRTVQARHQHNIWSPIDGHRQVSLGYSINSKKTGQRCCCRDHFGNFSFGETVISKERKGHHLQGGVKSFWFLENNAM